MPVTEIGTQLENAAVGSAKVSGAVFIAPTSVPLPTDATTLLPSEYKLLSYTSSEGPVVSESSSAQKLRVWEGLAVARVVNPERTEQLKFTPVNLNARVMRLMWGAEAVNVDDQTGALSVGHHGNPVEPYHIVIEALPWKGAVQRLCAKVQVSEKGDQSFNGKDFEGRALTLDCLQLPDGFTMHEYVAEIE